MSLLGISKIWGKGYTTVPNAVRKVLELDNGVEIKWVFENGKITVKKEQVEK